MTTKRKTGNSFETSAWGKSSGTEMSFHYAPSELPIKHRVFLALHEYLPCNTPGNFSVNNVTA